MKTNTKQPNSLIISRTMALAALLGLLTVLQVSPVLAQEVQSGGSSGQAEESEKPSDEPEIDTEDFKEKCVELVLSTGLAQRAADSLELGGQWAAHTQSVFEESRNFSGSINSWFEENIELGGFYGPSGVSLEARYNLAEQNASIPLGPLGHADVKLGADVALEATLSFEGADFNAKGIGYCSLPIGSNIALEARAEVTGDPHDPSFNFLVGINYTR
ncbi:MAG: hypothetical protein KDD66_16115 [Bdellovibrionales bacterium]|nr:hypothetical protein [Bdellovibrionales bacterium]